MEVVPMDIDSEDVNTTKDPIRSINPRAIPDKPFKFRKPFISKEDREMVFALKIPASLKHGDYVAPNGDRFGFTLENDPRRLLPQQIRQSILDCNIGGQPYIPWKHARDIDQLEKNILKQILDEDIRFAIPALEHFNDNNDVKYELKQTMGTCMRTELGGWFHCNFLASPKHDSNCDDPSPKLFFAEVRDFPFLSVKTCCILDGSEIVHGCGFCPYQIGHPVSGFECGRH